MKDDCERAERERAHAAEMVLREKQMQQEHEREMQRLR